jgi:hypothetical protein
VHTVLLGTLITRVRQRYGGELAPGASMLTANITDWEITDCINVSWKTELYDVVRASVGDKYYESAYVLQLNNGTQIYDIPRDHLATLSIDVWLGVPTLPGSNQLKINGMRSMEYERNLYNTVTLGWGPGCTFLYTLQANTIKFQPTPVQALYVQMNYIPVPPDLGGGQLVVNGVPQGVPCNYDDPFDDINGWAEVVVLDAARKCCLKLNRLDMVAALTTERDDLRKRIQSVVPLRHAGEPERANFPQQGAWGGGYGGDGWGM